MTRYRYGTGVSGRRRREGWVRARNTLIVVTLLVMVCVIAGAVYTWFVGRNRPLQADSTPQASTKASVKKPVIDPEAAVGVALQASNSPLSPGDNVMLGIHTLPEAICAIKVTYNNIPVQDSGITEKVADEYGAVSWSWSVAADAPLGTWPVDITCTRYKKSGYLRSDVTIKQRAN